MYLYRYGYLIQILNLLRYKLNLLIIVEDMANRENYDYLFKMIIIGNSSTGKSCLLHQFIENRCKYIIDN